MINSMTMRYIKSTIIVLSAVVGAACQQYLDIKPYGQTIPETAEEFSALLHNMLYDMDYNTDNYIMSTSSDMVYMECYADNLATSLTVYPTGNQLPLYIGSNLSGKQSLYSHSYENIRNCNIIIGYMEERDSDEAHDILAAAHAIRGVCYYNLLRDFCQPCNPQNPPAGLALISEFDMEARPVRSSYAATVRFIERDLQTAISYGLQNEIYRFTPDVVRGYLARLYFWAEEYGSAAKVAAEVLENHPLLEGEEYTAMFGSNRRSGNMLIKTGIYSSSGTSTGNSALMNYLSSRPCSKQFFELFREKERDIRYAMSVDIARKAVKRGLSCLRSAELQLILAESLLHEGDTEGALRELNALRAKRIEGVEPYTPATLPPVDGSDLIKVDAKGDELTPLLYAILTERRKELFMEGDRWYELKRNGRPEFWVPRQGMKYTTLSYMYTFPIEATDVQLTPGLEQNPGYDRME